MNTSINQRYLLLLLATLSTIAPISIATYLPSMPIMSNYFKVSISDIELSLSIFMLGFSIGQIFGGPLSDRKGRRFSSITGLIGFSIFSFLIIFSTSVYELWIYRFFEAFFGGLVVINSTAIIRDIYGGKEAAKFFSLLGSVRSIVPMLAPALGSLILFFFSWKAIFIFLTFYALILAILIAKDLKETYTYKNINVIESYKSVLTHKKAMMMIFILALGFASMFSIVTKASYIYMEHFNISVNHFPLYYGFNFLLVVFFASLNVKLIKRFKQINILNYAVILQIIFAIAFTLFYSSIDIYYAVILIGLYIGMNGLIFGNATAIVMKDFPKNAGVASALIGVVQFGLTSIISSIIVFFNGVSLLPVGIGMILISASSFLLLKKY